ncbi:MAG: hypothetical protein COA52_10560 [Hyphomicrobiales bacterium]|nr:hypothetical protein [Hyphomicrobiales bacterium]PCJ90278.1 MAG: hypothetical protein COA52_10560 [Hyphomicrobiales bacterium]
MAKALRNGVAALESTTKVTLAILALASGIYTYLGVRELLDGTANLVFFGAVIYAVAVSVGIFAFWSFLMKFAPHVRSGMSRLMLFVAMGIGSVMIVAMSSWLNAAALAGSAALEQHLAETIEDYQQTLSEAHNNALAAQSLLPDIQLAANRFARLSSEENASGALTGTSGTGTVVQLLRQMSTQLKGLASEVEASREPVKQLFEQGGDHLARMRRLVSANGPIAPRSDAFAEQVVALTGIISALQETSIAPAVKRAADDLTRTFIAPVANGNSRDLASRQTAIIARVREAISGQGDALSEAAQEILDRELVKPKRFVPLSAPEAVLQYAGEFVPSWAGAISIDLLPAVLILIMCIVQAAIRSEEDPNEFANTITANDMVQALSLYDRLQDHRRDRLRDDVNRDRSADDYVVREAALRATIEKEQAHKTAQDKNPAHTSNTAQAKNSTQGKVTPITKRDEPRRS